MIRSEYAANRALESRVQAPTGWMVPSTCVRRRETAFARLLKAVFGRGVL